MPTMPPSAFHQDPLTQPGRIKAKRISYTVKEEIPLVTDKLFRPPVTKATVSKLLCSLANHVKPKAKAALGQLVVNRFGNGVSVHGSNSGGSRTVNPASPLEIAPTVLQTLGGPRQTIDSHYFGRVNQRSTAAEEVSGYQVQ